MARTGRVEFSATFMQLFLVITDLSYLSNMQIRFIFMQDIYFHLQRLVHCVFLSVVPGWDMEQV